MKFKQLKRNEQEEMLMPILIKLLQNLGGEASRQELKHEIKTSVHEIPESVIDETRPTKNGGLYHPFNFVFNFSITHLEMAGFLTRPERGMLALTEKGRMCKTEQMDIETDIYIFSKPQWEERSAKRKKQSNQIPVEAQEYEHIEDSAEDWRMRVK